MKLSIVLSTQPAQFQAATFKGDLETNLAQIASLGYNGVELAIRDLKQYFGLGDYQCYRGAAIHRFVHLACVAFCGFRLIQLRRTLTHRVTPLSRRAHSSPHFRRKPGNGS